MNRIHLPYPTSAPRRWLFRAGLVTALVLMIAFGAAPLFGRSLVDLLARLEPRAFQILTLLLLVLVSELAGELGALRPRARHRSTEEHIAFVIICATIAWTLLQVAGLILTYTMTEPNRHGV